MAVDARAGVKKATATATTAAAALAVLVAICMHGGVSGQGNLLLEVFNAVNEECRGFVFYLTGNCTTELDQAGIVLGFEWPPATPLDIPKDAVLAYFESNPPINPGCCEAACLLANRGCLCDQVTLDAITKKLFVDNGTFFTELTEFVSEVCVFKPAILTIDGTCDAPPENVCVT